MDIDTLPFLDAAEAETIRKEFGTPCYVYSERLLRAAAEDTLAFPHAYGLTVRYAMKALPTAAIVQLFCRLGLHFDASSLWEVRRALAAGIPADRISLSTQELGSDFPELVAKGVTVNLCSLDQVRRYGEACPEVPVGLRFNPGRGSGGNQKTNTGGPASSFGIWHEALGEVRSLVDRYDLRIHRIHTHIGSGSDPDEWQRIAQLSLALVPAFPDVTTLNLGGGYKVARRKDETGAHLPTVGAPVREVFTSFAHDHGRKLHLEIEPGTYLVANAGILLTTIQDTTETGSSGYRFLKLDAGMSEILRPCLYGSQHPMAVLPGTPTDAHDDYIVVGHACESGDLLTCAPGLPDVLAPRKLTRARLGDLFAIGGAGAYCSAMNAKNYNSFPEAPEILLREDGSRLLIRRRQTLEQLTANDLSLPT